MFSQQPGRTVYVQPQVKYQAAASMGQNYSLMGTGPMGGQLFTGDATNAGGCPNPQMLLSPQPDPSQYNVQAAFQQQYPRPISPSEMSYFYNQPRPSGNSPGRMSSAPEVPQLTLPLSSRGTSGPGLPVQGGANSHAGSPSATSLSMELRAGAKQTWEAAAAQCSLSEEVKAFLGQMGFDCYLEAFRKAGFEEMDIVLAMSQDDMRSLGMLPGHVLKMDMKLDELCKSQGKVRRSKRLQFPPGGMPWMAMQAHAHAGPSPTAASPNGAAACIGMQAMLPMSRTIVSGTSTPMAPSPKAHAGKVQLALSPVRSNSPSPVEKDIQQFSAGWTDGRENAVTTVDEESDSRSEDSEPGEEGEERASTSHSAPLEGSSEPNPSSGSPNSVSTFTPHPVRSTTSFNTLKSGVIALPPRDQLTFGSGCTGISVRTAPVGTPSGRFGAGARKLKRDEMDDILARKQANKKVFAWLQHNRFSNVNAERWFLGRGYYPLHTAVRESNVEMVRLLLELKADPSKKNSGGQNALEYAQSKQRTSVICDLLQEYLPQTL